METLALDRPVAKKTEPLKTTESVRIDLIVLRDARIAASFQGKQVGEYISDVLRPIVEQHINEGYSKRAKSSPKTPKR